MRSITEFAQPILQKVLAAKTALTAEGKSPEEVTASLGETFKLEGDKLKYIQAAADLVVGKQSVRRVMVASFAEGETAPARYQKIDDTYYLVEILELTRPTSEAPTQGGGRGGPRQGGRKSGGGPKGSPWGISPEELEAKKKSSKVAVQAKK